MNERELAENLLSYDAAEVSKSDPGRLAAEIIRRDQRWTSLWSVGAILVWHVTAALLYPLVAEIRKMTTEIGTTLQKLIDATKIDSHLPEVLDRAAAEGVRGGQIVIALMVVATVLTVLLVRSSRRATLRQVNANLMQISRQIEGLKAPAGGDSGRRPEN